MTLLAGLQPSVVALQECKHWDRENFRAFLLAERLLGLHGYLGRFLCTIDKRFHRLIDYARRDQVLGWSWFSLDGGGIAVLVPCSEVEGCDDLVRRGGELRTMVEQCLPRGGELEYVDDPVHLRCDFQSFMASVLGSYLAPTGCR